VRRFLVLAALLVSPAARAVDVDWLYVGDSGNACDVQPQGCFGSVPYSYEVSRFEVTNAQYAEFLNAVADSDPNGLYHLEMGNPEYYFVGGIARSGASGTYVYGAIPGRESRPVNWVSFYDALRFANWLHNGQPTGPQGPTTTEDGAYTITAAEIAANSIARNAGATIVLTSEDEWYKAAYYSPASASYFDYPFGSDAQPSCGPSQPIPNLCNECNANLGPTPVGAYSCPWRIPPTALPGGDLVVGSPPEECAILISTRFGTGPREARRRLATGTLCFCARRGVRDASFGAYARCRPPDARGANHCTARPSSRAMRRSQTERSGRADGRVSSVCEPSRSQITSAAPVGPRNARSRMTMPPLTFSSAHAAPLPR
jgi:hypothetical protein